MALIYLLLISDLVNLVLLTPTKCWYCLIHLLRIDIWAGHLIFPILIIKNICVTSKFSFTKEIADQSHRVFSNNTKNIVFLRFFYLSYKYHISLKDPLRCCSLLAKPGLKSTLNQDKKANFSRAFRKPVFSIRIRKRN